jgi:hypothetical protein
MIWDVAETIALLTECLTLEPGDVIAMGTPAGVGQSRTPPVWMKARRHDRGRDRGRRPAGQHDRRRAAMKHFADNAAYDVVVIGFGPSGAVAAALLGQAGVRTLVVDRTHEVYPKPRAIALDHEIMRVFQNLGLAEAIAPHCEPFTPSEYYGADGRLIKRLATVAPPYPLGHTPSMVFTQPPVEAALRRHVEALPTVEVALGWRFSASSRMSMAPPWAGGCRRHRVPACMRTLRDRLRRRLEQRARGRRHRRWKTCSSTSPGWWSMSRSTSGPGQAAEDERAVLRARASVHLCDRPG